MYRPDLEWARGKRGIKIEKRRTQWRNEKRRAKKRKRTLKVEKDTGGPTVRREKRRKEKRREKRRQKGALKRRLGRKRLCVMFVANPWLPFPWRFCWEVSRGCQNGLSSGTASSWLDGGMSRPVNTHPHTPYIHAHTVNRVLRKSHVTSRGCIFIGLVRSLQR